MGYFSGVREIASEVQTCLLVLFWSHPFLLFWTELRNLVLVVFLLVSTVDLYRFVGVQFLFNIDKTNILFNVPIKRLSLDSYYNANALLIRLSTVLWAVYGTSILTRWTSVFIRFIFYIFSLFLFKLFQTLTFYSGLCSHL